MCCLSFALAGSGELGPDAQLDTLNAGSMVAPMPKGMSGIFVINETQGGFIEQSTPCASAADEVTTRDVGGTVWHLCRTPDDPASFNYQRTMESTWANPAVTGVYIRLKWGEVQTGPDTYDDTILLREVDAAVAHGKQYSIGIKAGAERGGTPRWLFDAPPLGAGLTPVLVDWNEDAESCSPGSQRNYGDPTDDAYRELYLGMLSHVAAVLKQDRARWRALASVKISGANSVSAENRLPNGCKSEPGCICNDQSWALAGYTPSGLYHFYEEQMALLVREFPGKTVGYPLIQDGFPRVNDAGCYLDATNTRVCPCRDERMLGPAAQTEHIIDHARRYYGNSVAIAHLGLGPIPDFSDALLYAEGTGCPMPLAPDGTPAHGPRAVGSGCPNLWASEVGAAGGLTYYQTNNAQIVDSPAQLSATLDNLWQNSTAAMIEVYEAVAWQSQDIILDPALPIEQQRTLADWTERLHTRGREQR